MKNISFIIILLSCFANRTNAQEKIYHISWKKDGSIYGAAIATNLLGLSLLNNVDKVDSNDIFRLNKNDIWAIDRGAINNYSSSSQKWSDILLYSAASIPFLTYFDKAARSEGGAIAIMAIETWLITNGITTFAKASANRYRPYVYNDAVPIAEKLDINAKRSFFSGHTSSTAAFSFFTAKVITDTHPNMKNKWLVWTIAATIPATVGYLRYEAGKHFPTDIITGYIVGAGIGLLVPQLHLNKNITVNATNQLGFSLTYKFK